MHRNDWLPVAKVRVSKGLEPDTEQSMCFGKVEHHDTVEALSHRIGGTETLDRLLPTWRDLRFPNVHQVHWFSPCAFVKGHPGGCGSVLPDIFLPDGRVKPQIERLLRNRRKPHGTLDATPGHGPDHPCPP